MELIKALSITCGSFESMARAAQYTADSLQAFAWSLPGRWPDPFVILKRADRTGVYERAFGGELFEPEDILDAEYISEE
jgi:hypothetical protein